MAELDTEGVRWCVNEHLSAVDFDAWHCKELAKAWEEGARAGWGASNDAGFDSDSYTYEEAEISNDNPYKEA